MRHTLLTLLLAVAASASAQQAFTLQQCIDTALVNNRSLQNAALEITASREQSKEAYTKYFPQISANVTAFRCFDKIVKGDGTIPAEIAALGEPFTAFAGMPFSYSELNRGYGAVLSVMEPIYAGGQITTGNKLARLGEEVSTLQQQLKEKEVTEKITENFWQIATLKYNLRTIAAAEKQIDAVMQQVQNFVDAGVTTSNALLQVKLRKQELASSRLKLENGEHLLLMLLEQQIGRKGKSAAFDILLPEESSPSLPEHTYSVDNRQELQLAAKGVEAQELQLKMTRGKMLPTVAVGVMGYNVGIGGFSENVKSNIRTNMTNGLVMGTIAIPISEWWGGTHAIRRQKAKIEESRNTLLDAREQLAIDNESAWCNLQEAYKQIGIAETSVAEAEENLRMQTEQYRAGVITITDLLDAETLNRKTLDQLSSARAAYQIALKKYELKTR